MIRAVFLFIMFLSISFVAAAQAQPTLTAETNHPSTSTFAKGEAVIVHFMASGLAPGQTTTLHLEIKNEFDRQIGAEDKILTANDDGNVYCDFTSPAQKLGYYEIHASLNGDVTLHALGTKPAGIISYAVVPDPAKRIDYGDTGSRFGMQGGFNKAAMIIPYLGVRYILAGNNWAAMEPQQAGQFAADRAKAAQAGKQYPPQNDSTQGLIYKNTPWRTYPISHITTAKIPLWALQPDSGGTINKAFGALNEAGEQSLPTFARAQAEAFAADYKNQNTRIYQVTWEPATGWSFGGTPQQLVDYYAKSYAAIHHGDPHAIVAGPTLFIDKESNTQLKELWAAGLGKYIDAFSIHPYVFHFPPEKNGLPDILRAQLKEAVQVVGHPLPFYGSEHGFKSVEVGTLNKAMGDIRTTLIMLGEGAIFDVGFYAADFWDGDDPTKTDGYGFYWNLDPHVKYGSAKLAPKSIVPAYAAMTYFLDGTVSKGALPNLHGTQMGYQFAKGGSIIDVVWDYEAQSSFPIPQGASVCDWMGNCETGKNGDVPVGGAPVYFVINKNGLAR